MAKSALRVLEILEFIADTRSGGATHTEISRALGIPKSSLTGLLRDLQGPGYLQLDPHSGRFSIGSQVMFLANAYIKNLNIVRVGAPFVHELFLELNEYTTMGIPKGDNCVVVCSETLPNPLSHSLNIGEHLPMTVSAIGRAILAFLDDAEISRFLNTKQVPYTQFTKTTKKAIRAELEKTRESGVSYVCEEYRLGITGFAAPVFNINNIPIASMGVAVPTARLTQEQEDRVRRELLKSTQSLSKRLGARLSASPKELLRQ